MSKKYRPSNGSEGADFMARFCDRCKCDAEQSCPIIADTMAFDIDDKEYPQEWVTDDDGRNPRCTAFDPVSP